MKKQNRLFVIPVLFLLFFLFTSLACKMTESLKISSAAKTPDTLATSLVLTNTAAQEETNRPTITRTPTITKTSSPTRTQTQPPEGQPSSTPIPPSATVAHQVIPNQPDSIHAELADTTSQVTADKGYAPEGDVFVNSLLLERPFTQEMKYRPDLDILTATIGSDANFIYVTLHLAGNNPDTNSLAGYYGVELDVDADGRGDYLVWTAPPSSSDWSTSSVQVLFDGNKDVGNTTALKSDAPAEIQGNGYEVILFSETQYSDPDAAWSRLGANEFTVQIAFRSNLFDEASFLWNVWADDGLKNPSLFDYNDALTLEQAGSPLQNSEYFPLKDLYNVDSTCRSVYNRSLSGLEPGLCSNLQEDLPETTLTSEYPVLTELPQITLPVP